MFLVILVLLAAKLAPRYAQIILAGFDPEAGITKIITVVLGVIVLFVLIALIPAVRGRVIAGLVAIGMGAVALAVAKSDALLQIGRTVGGYFGINVP